MRGDYVSLRDYFAARALAGCLAYSTHSYFGDYHTNSTREGLARRCYDFADAMMKVRAENDGTEGS